MSTEGDFARPAPCPVSTNEHGRAPATLQVPGFGFWELRLSPGAPLVLSPDLRDTLGFGELEFDGTLRRFMDRVDPVDRGRLLRKLRRALNRGSNAEIEFRFLRNGSAPGWLLVRGATQRDAQGRPLGLFGVAVDITPQKAAELEAHRLKNELQSLLAQRTAQLKAVTKELEAFCYSVSHDLRAPLRSIRGFNEVLLERYCSALDSRGQGFLRRACESSRSMDEMIEGLLKLSRAGRSELVRQPVDLSAMALAVAAELASSDTSRKVAFKISPGLRAQGDAHLLELVLRHLLGNAWKFSSKRPEASIEFGFCPAENAFYVRDNGVGFDPAYGNRLFGVFQRLHAGADFPGLGMGLALVQRIVNRHGGRVWATGAVDGGAVFYFSLPNHEPL